MALVRDPFPPCRSTASALVAVLSAPELGRRILAFIGPRIGLLARQVSSVLAQAWALQAVTAAARTSAWRAHAFTEPVSLHTLLQPFSRAHSCGTRSTVREDEAEASLFDVVFVLLARTPAAAEEPQVTGRMDEECAVVENMRRPPLIVAARCGLAGIAWLIARAIVAREAERITSNADLESGKAGGSAVNERDAMGCTALRYAIVNKDIRMCACLLSFSAVDIELRDTRRDTALLQAVGANVPAVCRMLLARGADIAAENRGQTALDLAEALGYEGCTAVLCEYGCERHRVESRGAGDPSVTEEHSDQRRAGDGADQSSSECELDEEFTTPKRPGPPRQYRLHAASSGDAPALSGAAAAKRHSRWDSGGLFIKTRGGQAQIWQG